MSDTDFQETQCLSVQTEEHEASRLCLCLFVQRVCYPALGRV